MSIQIELSIRTKFHEGLRREEDIDITTVVIHGAGEADSAEGLISWMLQGKRKKEYKKGEALFHYIIDRDGEITEIIDPEFWVYHSSSGIQDQKTIGIELINGHWNNLTEYSEEQYKALFWLIFEKLIIKYPTIDIIASHNRMSQKFSGVEKNCPGEFDWSQLELYMDNNGYRYIHDDRYESYWGITYD